MIYKNYCSKCKTTENLMPNPYATTTHINGTIMGYFKCRPCNASKARNYRKTKAGKKSIYNANKKQYQINGNKWRARALLNYHLKKGHIIRPTKCSKCRKLCTPDGHHSDYSKPLEVKWLCRQCHSLFHTQSNSVMI